MTARSSNAFLASLGIHGLIVAAIFFSAYFFHEGETQTKIMELVAGAGDNYGATAAPALGSPDSQKTDTAAQPTIQPDASPVAPLVEASPPTLEAVAPPSAQPVKPVTKAPDFTRVVNRVETRIIKKYEKQQKAEADAAEKAEAAKAKEDAAKAKEAVKNNQMTKEEFDRRFGNKANPGARANANGTPIKIAKIDTKGIAGGVVGGSTENTKGGAGGKAMTREEGDELDGYFSMLMQRLKDAHNRPEGLSDLLTAKAEFLISHDGMISEVTIIRSSGSPEFDQSVLSAFRNVGSIGPRPDNGGTLRKTVTFKMKDE